MLRAMKKNKFILLVLFLYFGACSAPEAIVFDLSAPMSVVLEQNALLDEGFYIPAWTASRFANEQREERSNGALREVINQIYEERIIGGEFPIFTEWQAPDGYPINEDETKILLARLPAAYEADSFSAVMPFNAVFFAETLSDVGFFLAEITGDEPALGLYHNMGMSSQIFLASSGPNIDAELFVLVAIHELGHMLGFGESLSELFAESYMGLDANPLNFEMDFAWLRGMYSDLELVYHSGPDRALLALVEPLEFWNAAATSNDAYAELWNANLGDIITLAELELARGALFKSIFDGEVNELFLEETGGLSLNWVSRQALGDFLYVTGQTSAPSPISGERFETPEESFKRWIRLLGDFAVNNDIEPLPSVLDEVILSHVARRSS